MCIKALLRFAKERPAEGLAHKVAKIIELKSVLRDNASDQRPHKRAAPITHAAVYRWCRRNVVVIQVNNFQVQLARSVWVYSAVEHLKDMDRESKVIRLWRKHRGIRGRRQALEIADASYLHELKHLGGNIARRGARSPMCHIRKRKAIQIGVEKHQAAPRPHKDVARIPVAHGDADVMEARGELAQIAKT